MLAIRPLGMADAPALLALRLRNRARLEPWEPLRGEAFYTLQGQQEGCRLGLLAREQGRSHPFVLTWTGDVIGGITLSEICRGVLQSANLGYWIDGAHAGRGHMTAAVRLALAFAFCDAGLHRVQAAVIPRNGPSLRVVRKAGFREEGLARRYLRINDVWEDHALFAMTREDWIEQLQSAGQGSSGISGSSGSSAPLSRMT